MFVLLFLRILLFVVLLLWIVLLCVSSWSIFITRLHLVGLFRLNCCLYWFVTTTHRCILSGWTNFNIVMLIESWCTNSFPSIIVFIVISPSLILSAIVFLVIICSCLIILFLMILYIMSLPLPSTSFIFIFVMRLLIILLFLWILLLSLLCLALIILPFGH